MKVTIPFGWVRDEWVPHHVTLSAERQDKEAMPDWLISRVAETLAPEGFAQWDMVATLVNGSFSMRGCVEAAAHRRTE